jgi:intracellular septation protein A
MYITQYKLSFHWYFGNNIFIGIKSTWISLVFLRTVFYSYLLDLCTHKISWAHEPLIIEQIVKLSKSHFKRFTLSWNSSFPFSSLWNYSVQNYYDKRYEKRTHVKMS